MFAFNYLSVKVSGTDIMNCKKQLKFKEPCYLANHYKHTNTLVLLLKCNSFSLYSENDVKVFKAYKLLLFFSKNTLYSSIFWNKDKLVCKKLTKCATYTKFPLTKKKYNFLLFKFFYSYKKNNFIGNPNSFITPFFFVTKNKISPFTIKKKTFVSQREQSYSCITFYMEKKSVFYKNSYFFGSYIRGIGCGKQINNRVFKLFTYSFSKTPYLLPQSKLFLDLNK